MWGVVIARRANPPLFFVLNILGGLNNKEHISVYAACCYIPYESLDLRGRRIYCGWPRRGWLRIQYLAARYKTGVGESILILVSVANSYKKKKKKKINPRGEPLRHKRHSIFNMIQAITPTTTATTALNPPTPPTLLALLAAAVVVALPLAALPLTLRLTLGVLLLLSVGVTGSDPLGVGDAADSDERDERVPEPLMDPEPEVGGRAVEGDRDWDWDWDWVGSDVGMGEILGMGRDVTELCTIWGLGRVCGGVVGVTHLGAPGSLGTGSRVAEPGGVDTAA
ncbi:hypothetical protein BDY19DRAFT_908529 [Irpex rosettiformis]|uniref:Uncharacterized protein n=1 Tax=Irpex rosettiformis TaxID=378272 RepID=A0ACB8TV98_9APHY|nr:hypothetical protein BDY19DRAFT_908529 [Irpex rosettiformis]